MVIGSEWGCPNLTDSGQRKEGKKKGRKGVKRKEGSRRRRRRRGQSQVLTQNQRLNSQSCTSKCERTPLITRRVRLTRLQPMHLRRSNRTKNLASRLTG